MGRGWKVRRNKPRTPRIFGICPQTIKRWTNIIINRGGFDPVVQLQLESRSWNRSYFQARGLERGRHVMKWDQTLIIKVTIQSDHDDESDHLYSGPGLYRRMVQLEQFCSFKSRYKHPKSWFSWLVDITIIIIWMVSIGREELRSLQRASWTYCTFTTKSNMDDWYWYWYWYWYW